MKTPKLGMYCSLAFLLALAAPVAGAVSPLETKKAALEGEIDTIEKNCASKTCGTDDVKKLEQKKSDLESLQSKFDFGIAIGFENYKSKYIMEVETVGDTRIVRITDRQRYKPSVWLETHYIWDGIGSKWGRTHSAPGFYVGARIIGDNSDVFDAFGLGVMWAFKRTALGDIPKDGQIAKSINIGVGPVWHKTKVLASSIVEGQPLPTDFNEVKLDSRDEISWMLMISAGF